jgi:hypothetical protein
MSLVIDRDSAILTATIPNGQAVSNVIDFQVFALGGLIMPSAWTAAAIAFKVSTDRVNFVPLKVAAGTLLELPTPAVSEARPLPAELAAFPYFQLWSETSGADVAQAADRAISLALLS